MFLIEHTAVLDDATPDDEIEFDDDLEWYRDLAIHESYWEQYNNQQKGAGCVVRMENRRWHYDEVARRSVWISSKLRAWFHMRWQARLHLAGWHGFGWQQSSWLRSRIPTRRRTDGRFDASRRVVL